MNRFQHRPHPKQPMTVAQSTNNLRMLLVGCSDQALGSFTPEYLASSYRVKPAEASKMLTEQRRHRANRA